MPRCSFTQHLTVARVKRGVQRQGAVTVVLKAVALEPPRRQRQNRIEQVEGLNGGFFVDPKYRPMLVRFYVQANNVGRLSLEVGIVGGHVSV